ncbi:hypothetical protein, partial [Desulfosporosinus fructosivorans]
VHSYILIGGFNLWLSHRKGGSENPELWLSLSGIVAQFAPDYSIIVLNMINDLLLYLILSS